ncbi:unnamed protein product [Blepharisma stoltei]|uniref:Uncharacterized protein n=1 Tax=Blepharisma stoltei TaxID=1481888 RepID=A0AAU9ITL5_9CILI|nr:unnamed protein product [Blepharisma stoltei]
MANSVWRTNPFWTFTTTSCWSFRLWISAVVTMICYSLNPKQLLLYRHEDNYEYEDAYVDAYEDAYEDVYEDAYGDFYDEGYEDEYGDAYEMHEKFYNDKLGYIVKFDDELRDKHEHVDERRCGEAIAACIGEVYMKITLEEVKVTVLKNIVASVSPAKKEKKNGRFGGKRTKSLMNLVKENELRKKEREKSKTNLKRKIRGTGDNKERSRRWKWRRIWKMEKMMQSEILTKSNEK